MTSTCQSIFHIFQRSMGLQLINSFAASVYIFINVPVYTWPDKSTGDKLMLQMKCNCWHRTREESRTHLSRITIIFAPLAWTFPTPSAPTSDGAPICSNSKNKWRQSTFAYFSGRRPSSPHHFPALLKFVVFLFCFSFCTQPPSPRGTADIITLILSISQRSMSHIHVHSARSISHCRFKAVSQPTNNWDSGGFEFEELVNFYTRFIE